MSEFVHVHGEGLPRMALCVYCGLTDRDVVGTCEPEFIRSDDRSAANGSPIAHEYVKQSMPPHTTIHWYDTQPPSWVAKVVTS